MPRRQLLLALSAGLLVACATPLRPTLAYLSGTVSYREKLLWPQDKTLLRVRLLALGDGTDAAAVIAEQSLEKIAFPATFSLCYDPQAIQAGQRYAVDVRLFIDGELRMHSARPYPVLDGATAAPGITLQMISA
ncbi:YbaY family lipoprotein [Vogesella fluminis]|uniref:YbaY family lipoprotein n=1 Tax=Vogesella fluminis TaxID=1069161 RepID=UPI00362989AA